MNRPAVNWRWRGTLLAGIAIAIFLAPVNLLAFAIKWGQYVHQNITRDGLNNLGPFPLLGITAPKFEMWLDTGAKVTFSSASIEELVKHNVATDDLQGLQYSGLHFDSEDLRTGSDRLFHLRQQIVLNLAHTAFLDFTSPGAATEREVRVTNSRAMLGSALHTLQDFYSHTNWVERHSLTPAEINSQLGNAIIPNPPKGTECDGAAPQASALTSGWFLDDPPLYCGAPGARCAHGGAICGIHKDFVTRTGFASAQAMAIKATNMYTQETLQAVLAAYTLLAPELGPVGAKQAVRLAVCEFMDVPNPLSTCATSHTVTVQKLNKANGQPTLEGLVQSSGNSITPAIDCGLLCQGISIEGSTVVLTAQDTPKWVFTRWGNGGACADSTSRTCEVDMTSDQTALAVFANIEPTPVELQSYQYSCFLELYQNYRNCTHTPDPSAGFAIFYEDLRREDYPLSQGGGFAYITFDGQVNAQAGQSSIQAGVDASAIGQWFSRGNQHISSQYGNSVLVTSNTLPPGTPVTVRATFQVNLQFTFGVTLSEPYIQWSMGWPLLNAVVQAGLASQPSSLVNPNGSGVNPDNWDPNITHNETVDLVIQSVVGASIPLNVYITASIPSITASRAHVQAGLSAQVNGPYLTEVNGLNVHFIGD